MEKKTKQRLEQLVRQGIVPSGKLPMLMQAMSSLHMGKQLSPTERKVLDKYMFNMTDIMLKDTTVFNRAKLHTQRTKYQTEETTVEIDENVRVVDGEEDMEVRGREKEEQKAKRLSVRKRDKYRLLSPELKKEKKKAGLDEAVVELNNTYQEMFEATLEYFEVSNIRDLPEEKKKEFFATVDEALEEAKMAKKDHDGDGKIETSTAEYMGSRDKAIKKAMKKEEVEQVNEYITSKQVKMAKGIANDPRHKGGDYSGAAEKMEKIKKGLSNHPAAKKALQQANEDVEQVDELKKSTLSSYIQKAADPVKKKSNVNLASKAAYKLAKDPDMGSSAGEKEDRKAFMRSKGIQTAAKKLAKEEANMPNKGIEGDKESPKQGSSEKPAVGELAPAQDSKAKLGEAMTPEFKAKRLEMIRQAHDRVVTGKTRGASAAKAAAKSAMKQKGAQKGMAPTKKDVEEQVQELRKKIKENNNKAEAYKLLAKILNNAENLGE